MVAVMDFRREPNPERVNAQKLFWDVRTYLDRVEPLAYDGRSRLFVVPRLALALHDAYTPTTTVTIMTDYDLDNQAEPVPGEHLVVRTCELGVEGDADEAYMRLASRCFLLPQLGAWFWRATELRMQPNGFLVATVRVEEEIERRMRRPDRPPQHRAGEMLGEFVEFRAKQQYFSIEAELRTLREVFDLLTDA